MLALTTTLKVRYTCIYSLVIKITLYKKKSEHYLKIYSAIDKKGPLLHLVTYIFFNIKKNCFIC